MAGCGEPAPPGLPDQVYVVGVDGLAWERIETLVEAGDLPNFARLLEGGTRAVARTPLPLDHGTLWATALTGKNPEKHRAIGTMTTLPSGTRIITPSAARQTKNLWQMLSDGGVLVAAVGFPGTWPAEVVNGFLASNWYKPTRWTETVENNFEREPGELDTYPRQLYQEIAPLIHQLEDLPRETASAFFTLREDEFAMLYDQPLGSVYRFENPLRDFALSYQSDLTNVDVALYLEQTYRPRAVGLYLELLAALQPVYWPFLFPSTFAPPAENQRRFKNTVNQGYRFVDEQLGRILERMPPRSTLVVVSDHGFETGESVAREDQAPVPVPLNSDEAVLLFYGHGIRAGQDLGTVRLTDATPTILALLGLDVAGDMDGEVLREAFQPAFLQAHPVSVRDSYDTDWDESTRYPPDHFLPAGDEPPPESPE